MKIDTICLLHGLCCGCGLCFSENWNDDLAYINTFGQVLNDRSVHKLRNAKEVVCLFGKVYDRVREFDTRQ